jgi:LemA protein
LAAAAAVAADSEDLAAAAAAEVEPAEAGKERATGSVELAAVATPRARPALTTCVAAELEFRVRTTGEATMRPAQSRFLLQAAIVIFAFGLSGCSYNRFTGSEEAIKGQWGQVQNQLQRRNDLIPNLVETVKGFAAQERDILTSIAASREKLAGARTPEDSIKAANEQSAALARLLVVVENYPNLKSDANFQRLMDELSGTENRIATERMRYNERVQEYNTLRRRFPANVTAKVFGFKEYPYYEAPAAAQQLPKVNFGR